MKQAGVEGCLILTFSNWLDGRDVPADKNHFI